MQKRIKTSVKRMTAGLLAFALVFSGMNMPVGAYAEELLSDETSIVSEEYESSVSEGYFVTEDVSESLFETEDKADITEADETEESEEEEIILSKEEGYASTEDGMIALTYMDTPGDHNAPAYYPSSKGGVDALRSTPLPSKYNSTLEELAEQGYPNTRSQSPWGSCWAHAAMATAEISMIKQGHANSSVDYSEFALAYFFYNTVEDPLGGTHGDKTELKAQSGETLGNTSSTMNYMERGGNNAFTWRALATWMGATEEKGAVVYPHSSPLPADPADSYAYDDAAILKDVRIYNPNTNRDGVKEAIRQSGAVAGSIYWSDGFYNSTYNSYYNPNTSTNHAITIVGWDDDFPASNFRQWTSDGKTYPEGNGAWLVRNSWSTKSEMTRYSYLWLSYEDKSINAGNFYQQIFVPASTYDNNYQYDGCVETSGSHRNKVANIFTIKGLAGSNAEILKAVSFSISEASDVPYTIKVYKNVEEGKPESGSLAATMSGTTTYAGYYTVDLDTPVLMARNTRFSVVVETEGSKYVDVEYGYTGNTWISFSCDSSAGESFVYSSNEWVEPSSVFFSSYSVGNICVKAFTKDAVVDGKYRICFDGNGSTSGSMAFLDASPGEEIQLSANQFERSGWFFKGWNTDPDGKGVSYTDRAKIKDAAEAGEILTLYAQWEYVSYEIRFFVYPDSTEPTLIMSDLKSSDGEITLPNYSTYSKTGYSCKGWCSDPKGTGAIYRQNTKLQFPVDRDHTSFSLYGIWEPQTYKLTLDLNTVPGDPYTIDITFDCSYGELPEPSYAGYTFWGWYTKPEGGELVTKNTMVTKTGSQNVYAHWYTKEVTVTLDPGMGSVSENSITVYGDNAYGYRYNNAGKVEYQEIPAATAPSGYRFIGWFTKKTDGTQVTAETKVPADVEGHTLYAKYEKKGYKIAFNSYFGEGSMETIEVPIGEKVSLPKNAFSKDGYFFDGWKATIDGMEVSFKDEEEVIDLAEEGKTVTLRAQWLDVEYSMYFYGYQLERPAIKMSKWWSSFGQVTLPEYSQTKYGYTFVGWSFNSDGSGTVYPAGTKIDCPASPDNTEISMYSVWKPDKYTLILDSNCEDVSSNSKDIYFDASYGELPEMSRPGHVFWGWYTDRVGGTKVTGKEIVAEPGDVTIYAHWYTKELVVTLDPGAGSVSENSIRVYGENAYGYRLNEAGEVEYQEIPDATPQEGFIFLGWFTSQDGDTKVTAETVVSSSEDHTLYAHYEEVVEINMELWIEEIGDYEYTGSAIKPAVNVYYRGKKLAASDYTLSYSNNVNAGGPDSVNSKGKSIAPTVKVKGKGNYEGTAVKTFTITPKDISAAKAEDVYAKYTGSVIKGKPVITDGSVKLKEGKDYALSYEEDPVDVGTYEITVVGKGNYEGTITCTEIITEPVATLMSKVKVSKIPDQKYTGLEIILAGTAEEGESKALTKDGKKEFDLTVKTKSGTPLVYGTDYDLEYLNNAVVGTATVIVKGLGSYSGTVKKTFKIKGTSIAKAALSAEIGTSSEYDEFYDEESKSFEYLGIPYEPAGPEDDEEDYGISLVLGETGLVKGVDYTVSYKNNLQPGKASVTFKGMGGYTGSVTKNFKIAAYDINTDTHDRIDIDTEDSCEYAKGGAKPGISVMFTDEDGESVELKEGKDYTVSCSNNKAVTTDPAKVTIKGKGAFKGSVTETYEINSKHISDESVELSLTDVVYKKDKAGICKTTVKLTDLDSGKALKAGTDYEKTFVYSYKYDTEVFDKSLNSFVTRPADSVVTKNDVIPVGTEISVLIRSKGNNYTGICEGTFRFVEKVLSKATVKAEDKTYLGGEEVTLDPSDLVVKFGKNGEPLTYGIDYVIDESTYKNNFKKGKATVIIRGISDRFGGTKKVTFKIKAKKMK